MSGDILVCSAGRRVELVRALQGTLRDLGLPGRVLAGDMSEMCAARYVADGFFELPPAGLPAFMPTVQELCAREGVLLVVPTTDTTLAAYAGAAPTFAESGTTVAISSPASVAVAGDKRRTSHFFCEQQIRTVRQGEVTDVLADADAWEWPLVVKPATGSSSIGVQVVDNSLQLRAAVAATDADLIVQERATGQEYTIDLFVDRDGHLVDAVPRERLEVRAGEVSKARTVRAQPLLAIAEQVASALPGGFGVLNLQVFWDGITPPVAIEINARFGGGFPLTHAAGAPFLRWLLESALGRPLSMPEQPWQDGLMMLRYDSAVLVRQSVSRA